MKLIFTYLKKYWIPALIAPLMIMLGVLADLAQPTLMATIVDEGIMIGDMSRVTRSGVIMLIFSLMGMLSGIIMSYCASFTSVNVGGRFKGGSF
jgi:ATP-binding cassette subfamily B multidrug efflux pump